VPACSLLLIDPRSTSFLTALAFRKRPGSRLALADERSRQRLIDLHRLATVQYAWTIGALHRLADTGRPAGSGAPPCRRRLATWVPVGAAQRRCRVPQTAAALRAGSSQQRGSGASGSSGRCVRLAGGPAASVPHQAGAAR
jgi:hypothetical protein